MLCAVALVVLAGISVVVAQDAAPVTASYTINPERVLNSIDEKVYGHFFEHIYHSANGGLWGELVWNRSFEENGSGLWHVEDGRIVQAGMGTDQRFLFGDPAWTDYEYTLEAQKTGGGEGFLILFRVAGPTSSTGAIGGWGNQRTSWKGCRNAARSVRPRVKADRDRQVVRIRCAAGARLQIWLDDEAGAGLHRRAVAASEGAGSASGTWATPAKFHIKVTAPGRQGLFRPAASP
jgi:alpha-N-arabinofuranosidase